MCCLSRVAIAELPKDPGGKSISRTLISDADHGKIRPQESQSLLTSGADSRGTHGYVAMADIELKRETGASLMFLGVGVWVMGFFVVFFLPSASKSGSYRTFLDIIIIMGVLGLILLTVGYRLRGKFRAE